MSHTFFPNGNKQSVLFRRDPCFFYHAPFISAKADSRESFSLSKDKREQEKLEISAGSITFDLKLSVEFDSYRWNFLHLFILFFLLFPSRATGLFSDREKKSNLTFSNRGLWVSPTYPSTQTSFWYKSSRSNTEEGSLKEEPRRKDELSPPPPPSDTVDDCVQLLPPASMASLSGGRSKGKQQQRLLPHYSDGHCLLWHLLQQHLLQAQLLLTRSQMPLPTSIL